MPSACHGVLPLFVVLCCAGLACSHMGHITADATALFLAAESGNHEEVRVSAGTSLGPTLCEVAAH